ncbi:FHA domain-containing protein [Tautonia marina]|uniref:FHA domain-containing protein n=1 Tax=Tautonia marina TaxID=2653855 RepID=UPI001261187F|nr:FHA domain-containing protein [Tautonia marina]
MEVRLVQLSAYGNEQFRMTERECVIGREPSCHLRPDHGRVSKRHCRLYWQGIRLFVEDINSADGTLVNGDRILVPTELHDGDELCAGPVHYLVMIADADEMAQRDASWVARAVKARQKLQPAASPSDSSIPLSPAMRTARSILDRIAHEHEQEHEGEHPHEHAPPPNQHGLSIEDQDGIALARILDRDLIDEQDIRRVTQQLEELILAGKVRIALDFRNVEHCSSQALSTVLRVYDRCRTEGGALKVCTVQPAVAQLFFMTDLHKHIEIFPDTRPALESVWPQPSPQDAESTSADSSFGTLAPDPTAGAPCVRLIVAVGKAKGRAIEVKGRRFVIGRDARCQLRPNSETISRIHAIIERRDGKVFVRDYGTKNGTILAGRTLRGEEAEAHDGDSLQVGVLGFSLQILPVTGTAPPTDDDILTSWLRDQASSANPDAPTALLIPTVQGASSNLSPPDDQEDDTNDPDASHADPNLSTNALACEIVRGVLVARIRESLLDDESTVGPLRYDLQTFFDKPLPRRVVLSMEHVNYLSSRAVGALLAFFQHLDREHGAMRVCCVSPKVLPVLDSMRLPKLVDLYASVEEAIDDPWI